MWFANNLSPEAWSISVLYPLPPHMLHVTDQIFVLSVLCTHCSEFLWLYLFLLLLLIYMQILRNIFMPLWQFNKLIVFVFFSLMVFFYIFISYKACLVVKNLLTCLFKIFLLWSFIFFLRYIVTDPRVASLSVCNWRWLWIPSKC